MIVRFTGLIILVLYAQASIGCELTMGYRTNERLPLIAESPNNHGVYHKIYSIAAKRIGCSLKVIRKPKKRILSDLKEGLIDFYPGFDFTPDRSKYVFYIPNGLPDGNIGVSRRSLNFIRNAEQLSGKTLIRATGSPDVFTDQTINTVHIPELTTARALEMIQLKRADFYVYKRDSLLYYMKKNPKTPLRLHFNCCGKEQQMYTGFSRKSKHYRAIDNKDFQSEQAPSPSNDPEQLTDSIALRFAKVLQHMDQSFVSRAIYYHYFSDKLLESDIKAKP